MFQLLIQPQTVNECALFESQETLLLATSSENEEISVSLKVRE